MARIATFVFSLFLLTGHLEAQDSAPYVSRLLAQASTTSVLLTWKDAEGYPDAQYEVWRSEKEIVKDGLSQAKLLSVVASRIEAFEDTTVTTPCYYLVLLRDSSGNRMGYYIPYKNKTTQAVSPEGVSNKSVARIKVGVVTYANPQVQVPFQSFPPDRKLIVFRRAAPITSLADLRDATLLGNTTGAQSPWKDTPAPGLEFYYAVLDAQAFADGKPEAFQDENTTSHPAGFPLVALPDSSKKVASSSELRPALDPSTRPLPLPRLQVASEPDSGAPLVAPAYEPIASQKIPDETQAALKKWSKTTTGPRVGLPLPMVLPEERSAAQSGAGRYLVQIQQAYLGPKDWKGAVGALESVLKLTLDDRTEARARFYLGESLAYLKDYRRAFVEVLSARRFYPEEVTPFLESLFTLLASTTE